MRMAASIVLEADAFADPQLQFVVRLQCLESGKALAAVKIVYAGDPNLQQRILGCQQSVLNLLSGLRRNGILDQPNSIFKENPGGVAWLSLWILPPSGSGVCESTPAIFIARLFAHPE